MLAIPRKQRAMVRKGIKNELQGGPGKTGVDGFFAVYADNVRRHGTPALSKRYFALLREEFGDDCDVLLVRSGRTGKVVSGVLSFYFRDEILPYYAGDALEARNLAANDFKYWELMRTGLRTRHPGVRLRPQQGRHRPLRLQAQLGFRTPKPLHYRYKLVRADRRAPEQPQQSEVPTVHQGLAAPAPDR
jgi:predicted N-acyltransferase